MAGAVREGRVAPVESAAVTVAMALDRWQVVLADRGALVRVAAEVEVEVEGAQQTEPEAREAPGTRPGRVEALVAMLRRRLVETLGTEVPDRRMAVMEAEAAASPVGMAAQGE